MLKDVSYKCVHKRFLSIQVNCCPSYEDAIASVVRCSFNEKFHSTLYQVGANSYFGRTTGDLTFHLELTAVRWKRNSLNENGTFLCLCLVWITQWGSNVDCVVVPISWLKKYKRQNVMRENAQEKKLNKWTLINLYETIWFVMFVLSFWQ